MVYNIGLIKLIIPDDTPQLNILFAWFRLKILTYILHLLLKREICNWEDEEKHRLVIFFFTILSDHKNGLFISLETISVS